MDLPKRVEKALFNALLACTFLALLLRAILAIELTPLRILKAGILFFLILYVYLLQNKKTV